MDLGAAMQRIFMLRLPGWLLILIWLFCIWRVIHSGWLQESWDAAHDYVREVKFSG